MVRNIGKILILFDHAEIEWGDHVDLFFDHAELQAQVQFIIQLRYIGPIIYQ